MKRKLQGRDKQRFDSADWEIEKTKVSCHFNDYL